MLGLFFIVVSAETIIGLGDYPLSQDDYRQEKCFRITFGGSTGKSCKSPGGYYIIKFLGNYFSHPVLKSPFSP